MIRALHIGAGVMTIELLKRLIEEEKAAAEERRRLGMDGDWYLKHLEAQLRGTIYLTPSSERTVQDGLFHTKIACDNTEEPHVST